MMCLNYYFSCKKKSESMEAKNAVIKVSSKLMVGVYFEGTLGKISPGLFQVRARPHFSYFCKVLKHFQVDLTVFTPPLSNLSFFEKKVGSMLPIQRIIQEHGAPQKTQQIMRYLRGENQVAEERVLFLDSSVSRRFNITQMLVLEEFRSREQQQGVNRNIRSLERALIKRQSDFTLVAAAELIKELTLSEMSVRDYLLLEPLVEKVKIPGWGTANYLPAENCEHMEELSMIELESTRSIAE